MGVGGGGHGVGVGLGPLAPGGGRAAHASGELGRALGAAVGDDDLVDSAVGGEILGPDDAQAPRPHDDDPHRQSLP